MIRSLRVPLLAAMATLAVSAVAAVGAQAQEFHTWSSETIITTKPDGTGKQSHHVFDVASGSMTCNNFEGELSMYGYKTLFWLTSRSIAYGGSCNFVGQSATVNMNGCDYEYVANGEFAIACPFGSEITFNVPSPVCDVVIPPQTGKGTITYTNINEKTEITVSTSVTGIKYTATGAGCPTSGTFENGKYTTGNVIWQGEYESTGLQTALWVE
jgi:hypothetical protein